jgi:hypothetical protein
LARLPAARAVKTVYATLHCPLAERSASVD